MVYLGVGYFEYENLLIGIELQSDAPTWRRRVDSFVLPSVFISISIGLTISVIYLLFQIHYHFDRSVLMDEKGRVRAIFLVFTLTYITRAIIYLLQMFVIQRPTN